ncbi:FAD-dependent oxidoreductase [Conexibacter sp. DBS9H8]|uniref:FAD-dependent oxidoreductase n=1 Tax=Conexibacter sp. DBS9H8 TaxID=2937801 RepID=UPI00200C15B8|nr:FAD-dependent oxidoreductase [Conexibacter sp. DBS9H8]
MPHVITQSCCSDASCTYACPVNCIQPTPDDPDFLTAEMLCVDPTTCVDCGACVSACPVEAIKPERALTEAEIPFLEINRLYHVRRAQAGVVDRPLLARPPARLQVRASAPPPSVAVVGSGPAGLYAADEILTVPGARVTVFERLSEPYGLARFGVAPDHRRTRRISTQFAQIRRSRGLSFELGVDVGTDVTRDELLGRFDAVIYAVGAAADRPLTLPGADLLGVSSATRLVAFYNGHPDAGDATFDLSGPRAVVIGNGNVGLDVARILTTEPDRLAETDIAPAALAALAASELEEVIVTSRRGPEAAAFTLPELLGLASAPGVELCLDPDVDVAGTKLEWLERLPAAVRAGRRRVRLRFGLTPERFLAGPEGGPHLGAVVFSTPDGVTETVPARLALTSIGYRAVPVPGLPFDPESHTVPHAAGRVIDPTTGAPLPGTYVTGWIKRGPSGFLGTNRSDAQETVRSLIEDHNAGRLGGRQPGGSTGVPVAPNGDNRERAPMSAPVRSSRHA